MAFTSEEFISSFHSLNGTTIGERRKHLFLLLNNIPDAQNIDFNLIQPKTHLEDSLKVDALICLRKINDLVDVLRSENPVLIRKILKVSSWFLPQALDIIKEDDFIKHVFPSLSFNAKVKIINKLMVCLTSTEQADNIFKAIKDKYGLYLAAKMLPCCTGKLIMEHIKLIRIEFTPRQLLLTIKKNPELTEDILAGLKQFQDKYTFQCKYRKIFVHILKNDPLLFLKLYKKYKPQIHLGWRATNRLVLGNRENIIKNANAFYKLLHGKQIIKSISKDFAEFYFYVLPKSLGQLKRDYSVYLDLLPSNVSKLEVLTTTFKRKFGEELWNDPDCVTAGLLEIMTSHEREAWMLTNPRPKAITEESWICLMKTDKAIPALKEKIASTSNIQVRAQLVGCLVETCRINQDKTALLSVCKIIAMQHRNDGLSVLRCFLNCLKSCFSLDELEDEHWKYIRDIVEMFVTKGAIPYYYHEWFFSYIHYRLAKNLPIKEDIKTISKKINFDNVWYNTYSKPQYEKHFLISYSEVMCEIHKGETLQNTHVQYLEAQLKWNRKHAKDQFLVLSNKEVLNGFFEVMKREDQYRYTIAANMLIPYFIKSREIEKNDFLNFCFRKSNCCITMTTYEWMIKEQPLIILKYIDCIVHDILDLWHTLIPPFFWMFCKNYTHLEIPQKIIAICLNTINSEESDSRKKNAITALSCLMQPEEFLTFIIPYYPSELVMDVNDEENQERYKIQQAITGCLKNVIPPSGVLESVLNFTKGDYLKFIQRSLHSVSHSVPETHLPAFFGCLTDRPVSIRKHAIYLTCKVLDKVEIEKMLVKFMETERNSSIRKFLFKASFRYFAKNPNDNSWNVVKQNIKNVDVNDKEAFDTLMETNKIPLAYLVQYLVFAWSYLEDLPDPDQKLVQGKCKLLDLVSSEIVPSLSKEFCMGVIEKYLFKCHEPDDFRNKLFSFTSKFVIYAISESEQKERMDAIFLILKQYVDTTWNKCDMQRVFRNNVFEFLKDFCSNFIEEKCLSKIIYGNFIDHWNNIRKPHEAFEEYLYLQFTLIYVDFVEAKSLQEVGKRLAALCDSLLNEYGNSASNIFCDMLNSYINNFLVHSDDSEESLMLLIESIILGNCSTNCSLMACSLLPQEIPTGLKIKMIYYRIISTLKKHSDGIVQLTLSCYFSDIGSRNTFEVPEKSRKNNSNISRVLRNHFIEDFGSKYNK